MAKTIEILGTIFGIVGATLVASSYDELAGYILMLASCPLLIYIFIVSKLYYATILQTTFLFLNIMGVLTRAIN